MDLVFVSDTSNCRMRSFRGDGTAVTQWGAKGSGDGEFQCPSGVAVLARSQDLGLQKHPTRNCIFVTDSGNDRIQVFDVDGAFLYKWGSRGQGDGQFVFPVGVAIHPTQDLVYVIDRRNHRVQVFGLDGTFIRKWGTQGSGDGQFSFPNGVAVHHTRDIIFISEVDCIRAFRSDGTFLYKWGCEGSANGQFKHPQNITLHTIRNLLFVSDCGNHRIQVFDLEGHFVCTWGRPRGHKPGIFCFPRGLSVHPSQNILYLSDYYGIHTISLFPTNPTRKRKNHVLLTSEE